MNVTRLGLVASVFLLLTSTLSAQQAGSEAPPPFAPAEIQKLLDGYAVIQAQESLGLNDAQFTSFLPKLRALLDIRRRTEQERLRLLQELRRITNARAGQIPDGEIRDRMRALRELETRALGEIQKAQDAVDQTLDVRQQARFRVFEQEIEQRKLQLLMRARQQANPNRANRPPIRPGQ